MSIVTFYHRDFLKYYTDTPKPLQISAITGIRIDHGQLFYADRLLQRHASECGVDTRTMVAMADSVAHRLRQIFDFYFMRDSAFVNCHVWVNSLMGWIKDNPKIYWQTSVQTRGPRLAANELTTGIPYRIYSASGYAVHSAYAISPNKTLSVIGDNGSLAITDNQALLATYNGVNYSQAVCRTFRPAFSSFHGYSDTSVTINNTKLVLA